jgi:hypothetical protein
MGSRHDQQAAFGSLFCELDHIKDLIQSFFGAGLLTNLLRQIFPIVPEAPFFCLSTGMQAAPVMAICHGTT